MFKKLMPAVLMATLAVPLLATAAGCPNLTRNLSFGSRGSDVIQLQNFLIEQSDLAAGNNTGYFGRLTESGVKKFQCRAMQICSGSAASNGYGVVGPRTRMAITAKCKVSVSPPISDRCANVKVSTSCPAGQSVVGYGDCRAAICSSISQTPISPMPLPSPLPTTCIPLSPQTQTLACPTGQTGSITQTRTSSCTPGAVASTWSNWQTTSNTCQVVFTRPPLKFPNSFQVLVGTNQLKLDEALQASRFAADGVWSIPFNSGIWPWSLSFNHGDDKIDWQQTLSLLNANMWSVSEDNPGPPDDPDPNKNGTNQVDFVSQKMGRLVDGAFFYIEDGLATPISDAQIAQYAQHEVPGYGKIGNRIIVLTRSYQDGDPRKSQIQHALANSAVAGATFEFLPNEYWIPILKYTQGCQYAVSLGKKCYFLLPPAPHVSDWLAQWKLFVEYIGAAAPDLLRNPNFYLVIATYVRPNNVHYVSSGASDTQSVQAIVEYLNAFRQSPPVISPLPLDQSRKPIGWLDQADCAGIGGWSQDLDTPAWPNYVDIYIDGKAQVRQPAEGSRPDLCNALGSCRHAFGWNIPAQYRDGRTHTLNAYGIDSTIVDTNNAELSGSPKTFQCN